jgi:hypothetical protein
MNGEPPAMSAALLAAQVLVHPAPGQLTPEQKLFGELMEQWSLPWTCVRSTVEALTTARQWGAIA